MTDAKLHIIVDKVTERLSYIFDFMFKDILQLDYILSTEKNFDSVDSSTTIHYGIEKPANGIWFKAHTLLFEKEIKNIPFDVTNYGGFKYPFAIGENGLLPFDPFALGFYFLTQYEEYNPSVPLDNHGRFLVKNSKIFPYIEFPMVDIVARIVQIELEKNGFALPPKKNRFLFTPTFDIDIAYAHLAKPLKRHVLGSGKLIAKMEFKQMAHRIGTWTKKEQDPYDVFGLILEALERNNLNALFFALVAKNTKIDNNNNPKSGKYQNLLKKLSQKHQVALHSSYYSLGNDYLLNKEKICLEEIIGSRTTANRQHFLKFRLPEYWHFLSMHEITDDYSVGFTDCWGYRSGTSLTHHAFDVSKNEKLSLRVHPFIFMDTALKKMYKEDVILITEKMNEIISESKHNGMPIIGVWHNYAMPNDSLYLESFLNVISSTSK